MTIGLLIEHALADRHYHDLQATLALGGNWLSAMARVVGRRSKDLHEDLCEDSHEELVKSFMINVEPMLEEH